MDRDKGKQSRTGKAIKEKPVRLPKSNSLIKGASKMTEHSKEGNDLNLRLVGPLSAPDDVIARITVEPRLLPIDLEYELSDATLNGKLTYEAQIQYSEHGRNDKTPIVAGSSNSLSFTIDFGYIVQGGTLQVDLHVPYRQPDGTTGILQRNDTWSIRGENPTRADVKSRLGEIELQVIAYKESRFHQFVPQGNRQGLPVFGFSEHGGGFGIMQLDPPKTARQIWDWKQNVDAGKALYATKQREVVQHFKNERQSHPEAPDLSSEQYKIALYQYYNGHFYWVWNSTKRVWEKESGINDYGEDCLRVEKQVQAGTPPQDWY